MLKRILAILFIAAILLSAVACATGNGGDETKAEETSAEESKAEDESQQDPKDFDDFQNETIDLGKRVIKIKARVESSNSNELDVEKLNAEPVNDAVYNRNLQIQDRLNCTIKVDQFIGTAGVDMDDVALEVNNMVKSGGKEIDIAANASYTSMDMAISGNLCDLKSNDNINFSKNYWSQGFNDALSIGDAQYLVTGPMSTSYYRYMFVTLFNKTMMNDHGIDSLYDTVNNNEWTIEYMMDLAETFYKDLNGSSDRDFDDRYGFITRVGPHSSMVDGYWEGTGICVLSKDEDNYLTVNLDKQRFSDSMDAVLDLIDSDGAFAGGNTDDDVLKKFATDEAAMINFRLIAVENGILRNSKVEYGIIPMPKLKTTDDYKTHVQVEVLLYSIPFTLQSDLDTLTKFLECFASESYNTVKPAYYGIALTSKYVKDQESIDMLDKVVHGVAIDPINLYCRSFNFTAESIRPMHVSGINTISSLIDRYKTSTNAMTDKLNKKFVGVYESHNKS